jgi:hypothetical protein
MIPTQVNSAYQGRRTAHRDTLPIRPTFWRVVHERRVCLIFDARHDKPATGQTGRARAGLS